MDNIRRGEITRKTRETDIYIVTELEARNQIEIYETSQEEVIFQ